MSIDGLISNATALSGFLKAADDFCNRLEAMREEIVELEANLEKRKLQATRELDALDAELRARHEEHRLLLASLQSIRRDRGEIAAQIDEWFRQLAA